MRALLRRRAVLRDEWIDAAVAPAAASGAGGLVRAACDAAAADEAWLERCKPRLLDCYVERVLTAKERPAEAAAGTWGSLLAKLTPEDLQARPGDTLSCAVLCCAVHCCVVARCAVQAESAQQTLV